MNWTGYTAIVVFIMFMVWFGHIEHSQAQQQKPFSVYQSGNFCVFITGPPATIAVARLRLNARCQ